MVKTNQTNEANKMSMTDGEIRIHKKLVAEKFRVFELFLDSLVDHNLFGFADTFDIKNELRKFNERHTIGMFDIPKEQWKRR